MVTLSYEPAAGAAAEGSEIVDRWPQVLDFWGLSVRSPLPTRNPARHWQPLLADGDGVVHRPPSSGVDWTHLAEPLDALAGIGAPGLAFLTAKRPATVETAGFQHGHLVVDAIHGLTVLDGVVLEQDADRNPLRRILLDEGVLQLTVVSHGDGGHLQLPGLVGCGVTLDVTGGLLDGSPEPGGCIAGVRCQRSIDLRRVIRCRDIRTASAVLLVCKAGLLTDVLRPTTTNVALAFLDGYARTVVAPAGLCKASPAITSGLIRFGAAGSSIAVRDYLDDVSGQGDTRFRVLGFPSELDLAQTHPDAATAPVAVHLTSPSFGLLWWSGSGVVPIPGRNACHYGRHLVLPTGADPGQLTAGPAHLPLVPVIDRWQAALDSVRLRHHQIRPFLPPAGADESSARERLADARTGLEAAVYRALEMHAAAREHGLAVLMGTDPRRVAEARHTWQGTVADTLAGVLRDSNLTEVLQRGLWARQTEQMQGHRCPMCGGGLTQTMLDDPLSGTVLLRQDCSRCGTHSVTPQTGVRDLSRGEDGLVFAGPITGVLLTRISYKGHDQAEYARHPVNATRAVSLPPPNDDRRTVSRSVQVVLVNGTDVRLWKVRL